MTEMITRKLQPLETPDSVPYTVQEIVIDQSATDELHMSREAIALKRAGVTAETMATAALKNTIYNLEAYKNYPLSND